MAKKFWVHQADSGVLATGDGSLHAGWRYMPNGKWFYFDATNSYHATFGLMTDGTRSTTLIRIVSDLRRLGQSC